MPTFTIDAPNGKSYTIDGESAQGALAALQKHLGESAAPDKYKQAALDERDRLKAAGVDTGAGLTRRAVQGATFGGADEILAGLQTPLEMARHGTFNPAEGYRYAKARENLILEDSRKNTGALGTAAEIGGGVVGGGALANAGLSLARPGMGLVGRILAGAGEGAGYGAVTGALDGGDSVSDRLYGAGKGLALGGVGGAIVPAALTTANTLAAPVLSNIRARVNPGGVAESQLARVLQEGGQTAPEVERALAQAHAEGQGNYTIADALGNSGQRALSGVARSPGEGRQAIVDFLENRQAGQGRRVANILSEGFSTRQTARQMEENMTAARDAVANAEYGAVRSGAQPVDVVGTIDHIDNIIGTAPGQQLQTPNDSIEGILRTFRERLSRVNPDDFEAVSRIRGEMADAAQSAAQAGQGNRSRLIGGAVRQLDGAMENASSGFRQANRNYGQASRDIEAVQSGRDASMRGRTEDTIPVYQGLGPRGQQAFRTGYADPLIEGASSAAPGVNKARPLLNDAFQQEAAAIAPRNDLMQRRLGRENTMFETRRQAIGGSQTADNLADQAALHVDPSLMLHVATGNIGGALHHGARMAVNGLTGNTPEVRRELARLLLMRGPGANIAPTISRVEAQALRRQQLADALRRGLVTGEGEFSGQRR